MRGSGRLQRARQEPFHLLLELAPLFVVLELDADALGPVTSRMDRVDPGNVPLDGNLCRVVEEGEEQQDLLAERVRLVAGDENPAALEQRNPGGVERGFGA